MRSFYVIIFKQPNAKAKKNDNSIKSEQGDIIYTGINTASRTERLYRSYLYGHWRI